MIVTPVPAQDCCIGMRGNIDNDPLDEITIADLVYLVDYMFNSGPAPECPEEANIDGIGTNPDIADLVYLVGYMFEGGPQPADCEVVIPDPEIVPLSIGNNWMYHVVEYNSSGGITDEYDTTSTVVDDTVLVDSIWYVVEDGTGAMSGIVSNWDEGLWTHSPDSTPSEILALKFPATIGDSYPVYSVTVHIDDTDANITVPAGTFNCYYYRMTVPIFGTVGKIWASPDVGIIKAEAYEMGLFTLYLAQRIELLSYELVD